MKSRSLILFFVFIFIFQAVGTAQFRGEKPKLKQILTKSGITISGNLKQLALQANMIDSLAFGYPDPVTGEDIILPIARDVAGNFKTHIPIHSITQLQLLQGTKIGDQVKFGSLIQFSLYAHPGRDFTLNFYQSPDHNDRRIEYKGVAGAINTEYEAYTKALGDSKYGNVMDYEELKIPKKDTLEAFKQSLTKRLKQVLAFNRIYFSKHKSDPFVVEQADIEQIYNVGCLYINVLLTEKIKDSGMLDFFEANQIIFNNPKAFANLTYQGFIHQYFRIIKRTALENDREVTITGNQIAQYILQPDKGFKEEEKLDALRLLDTLTHPSTKESKNLFYEKYVSRLAEAYLVDMEHNLPEFDYIMELKDPYLRDIYATKILYQYLSPTQIAYIKPNLKLYRERVSSMLLKNRFLKDYQKIYDQLYGATLSEGAIFCDAAQLDTKDPLRSILSKYKGKVVYLDIWATWCAPCIAEMPNSAILRKQLAGKDVVFVYLCVSSAQEKVWKELVASQIIEGENYFLNRELYSPIASQLQIKSVPRYLIVDKDGSIVQSNAGRPGNPATLKQLIDLL